jgi:O-antigen/teichoic acid export membrane protein
VSGSRQQRDAVWQDRNRVALIGWNVGSRYVAIGAEAFVGLLLLPFNVSHLGKAAYGLWMLVASVTVHFSALDLGYGQALVKFVAQYRASRDAAALNQIISTLFFVFAGIGLLAYAAIMGVAFSLGALFNITAEQALIGRTVLLIIGLNVAVAFPFIVFGAILNGFQRHYLASVVSVGTTLVAAGVNVAVILAGHGLVGLVAATTLVRIVALGLYAASAYRVFPMLSIHWRHVRLARLREVSGFSVYMLLLDWAYKLNHSADPIIIGAMIGSSAVAVWTVAQRLTEVVQRLTNQLNDTLFPLVVDSDARSPERLRMILVQGTRLSLVTVVLLAGGLALAAGPLVHAWVGIDFAESVLLTHLLALAVIVRVGTATATTVLKGAGRHKMLAKTNILAAAANVGLTVVLVRAYGLPGAAAGTLAAVAAADLFVLFPAACKRVGISTARALAEAVWPAVWPSAVMVLWMAAAYHYFGSGIVAVIVNLGLAGILYLIVFWVMAISSDERQLYKSKAAELLNRRSAVKAAA